MGKEEILFQKNMKYVAAYCLLVLGGKESPSEADLKNALKAAGCDINDDCVKAVCNALKGKALHEVVAAGYGKIASLSLGGGGGSGGNTAAQPTGGDKAEEKKEEKPAEAEEESEDYDVGDLFG